MEGEAPQAVVPTFPAAAVRRSIPPTQPVKNHQVDLAERDVRIPCKDAMPHGTLTIPCNPRGLVIFAHGSGSSRFSPRNRMVAARMHHRKLATLVLDLLTHEEASSDWTATLRYDIPLLAERLESATRWVEQQDGLQNLGIGYFGASTGAAAAVAAAARLPEIRAVVSRGGRIDLAEDSIDWVAAPTLLIVGEFDQGVASWNQESFKHLNCEKQILLVPGATHLFQEPKALELVAELAASWFEKHLPPLQQKLPADQELDTRAA